jgi:hypothetical protein
MAEQTFTSGQILTAAQMTTLQTNIGLAYVGAGTLSLTTSATNVTGVFSSTYKQYRLLLNVTARSTTNRVQMKYIVGTTPTSTAYYQAGLGGNFTANSVLYHPRTDGGTELLGIDTPALYCLSLDIYNANKATTTMHHGTLVDANSGFPYFVGGSQTSSSQFTGFQLFTTTGTATVEYQVFGYRD